MCGISGLINFNGSRPDEAALRRMTAALRHRGPDGEGFFVRGGVGFGHRRLAIIDPRGGHQPFVAEPEGLALTYNGEVYNYREIRSDLGNQNWTSSSDTEVVLRAYGQKGIACLDEFRGMFAFALFDERRRRVYLVRDRLGIKPLYYHANGDRVAFASELGALLEAGDIPTEIDRRGLAGYLRFGYLPAPGTIYRGVLKLEPGTYIEIDLDRGRLQKRRYWNLEPTTRPRSESDALEELDSLLDEIIRLYLRSDVPFGVFLSGGVDSSLVAALMARVLDSPVRSFSIGFSEEAHTELPFAAEAARVVGARHHEQTISAFMALDVLSRLVRRFGEPFADSSMLPAYYVSKFAAGEVKMVLSGDGGDELFAGYQSYPLVHQHARMQRGPSSRFTGILEAIGWNRSREREKSWQAVHYANRELCSREERNRLLGEEIEVVSEEELTYPVEMEPVTKCQYQDLTTYLLDDILTKVDRAGMDNSLEVRVPLLDHKLVEFAFSLPMSLKLRGQDGGNIVTKYLLKRSAQRFFTPAFLARPKMGFGIPIVDWVRGPLARVIRRQLVEDQGTLGDYLDRRSVHRVVDEFFAGDDSRIVQLWPLFCFRLWLSEVHEAAHH